VNCGSKSFYKKKIQKVVKLKKEMVLSDLTEDQLYFVRAQLIQTDEIDILIEFGMKQLLSKKEEEILYLIYAEEYSAAEIAGIRAVKTMAQADGSLFTADNVEWRAYDSFEESIIDHNDYIKKYRLVRFDE